MKDKIKNHLYYNWGFYLAIFLIVIIVWPSIFTSLAKPKANEKITITCFVDKLDAKTMDSFFKENISNITNQNIKEIYVENCYNSNYAAILLTTKPMSSDIIICNEKYLKENEEDILLQVEDAFSSFTKENLKDIIGNIANSFEYYIVDDKIYGIYLDGNNNFNNFYKENDRCVLFFCNDSLNNGALYNKGSKEDTSCIDILIYLLEEIDG